MAPPVLQPQALNRDLFSPYGEVISAAAAITAGKPAAMINRGICERFSNIADIDIDENAIGLSLFRSRASSKPVILTYLERHPLGSQAFLPMNACPFLVIVAADSNGQPENLQVFTTDGSQGVNIQRNTWHAPLCVLDDSGGLFTVIDYNGTRANLEEFLLPAPVTISV